MIDPPEQIFIGQNVGARSYSVRLERSVAERIIGHTIVSEDELIEWAEASMDSIIKAADHHRERNGPMIGGWQDLEVKDFASGQTSDRDGFT